MRRLLWPLVMLISLLTFMHSVFADGVAPPPTQAQNLAMLWPLIGSALSAGLGYGLPRLSAKYTFFHTGWGAFVIALIGALVGSVIPVFQAGSVTWVALAWAATNGFVAFCARLNPSSTADDPPAKSPLARPGSATNPPPPPIRPGVLLPLAFMAFALAGCPHPVPNPNGPTPTQQYDAAFAQCMKTKGITVAVNDGASIWQILDNPNTTQAQKVQALEALGITTVAGGLTDLASCALYAWDQINPMLADIPPTPAQAAKRVFVGRHAPTATPPKSGP
jgi:hypothetical protein